MASTRASQEPINTLILLDKLRKEFVERSERRNICCCRSVKGAERERLEQEIEGIDQQISEEKSRMSRITSLVQSWEADFEKKVETDLEKYRTGKVDAKTVYEDFIRHGELIQKHYKDALGEIGTYISSIKNLSEDLLAVLKSFKGKGILKLQVRCPAEREFVLLVEKYITFFVLSGKCKADFGFALNFTMGTSTFKNILQKRVDKFKQRVDEYNETISPIAVPKSQTEAKEKKEISSKDIGLLNAEIKFSDTHVAINLDSKIKITSNSRSIFPQTISMRMYLDDMRRRKPTKAIGIYNALLNNNYAKLLESLQMRRHSKSSSSESTTGEAILKKLIENSSLKMVI